MNLHTSYSPFWNGMSISNLLILSNLEFLPFSDKIFIGLGSIPGVSDTKETELIDIDQAFSRCKSLGKYPLEIGYNAYGLMKGQPLICGGYKKTKPIRTNACYLYYKVASYKMMYPNLPKFSQFTSVP